MASLNGPVNSRVRQRRDIASAVRLAMGTCSLQASPTACIDKVICMKPTNMRVFLDHRLGSTNEDLQGEKLPRSFLEKFADSVSPRMLMHNQLSLIHI